MAVGEGRVQGRCGRRAGGDRGVDDAVELAERVGEALGVAGREVRRRGGGAVHQGGVAQQQLVGPPAVAEPQLLRALGGPRERACGAVDLERQEVAAPGADLRDRGRGARAAVEAQQQARGVLGLHRVRERLASGGGASERLDRAHRLVAHGHERREVGAHRGHVLAGDERHQVDPVRADVADRAQAAAHRRVEPPVPVGVQEQPVLQVAAADQVDVAQRPGAHPGRGLLDLRVEADVEVHGVHEPGALGERHELGGLARVHAERLLADDVLAGLQHRLDLRVVEVVGRREVDDVHARVREHRLEAVVGLGEPGLGPCALRRRSHHADDLDAEAPQRVDVHDSDEAGAHHRGTQIAHTAGSLSQEMTGGRAV